ncbi:hypothetical protein ACWKYF_08935 [Enterobacter asburiae]
MKLLNYNLLLVILLLSGCSFVKNVERSFWITVWGNPEEKSKANAAHDVFQYCESKKLKSCDIYKSCFVSITSKFPGSVQSIVISRITGHSYKCMENKKEKKSPCLFDSVYDEMEIMKDKGVSSYMYNAYIIYAHNSCALVTDDKMYDIEHYKNIIDAEIKSGKSKRY